ncbi:MAG: sulfotransferase [Gammaproteobacteria bacterium]
MTQKVIIIGAPRSGTNMLRDTLTSFPGVATWPCDEINYIWRHGNLRYPSDEFPADLATPKVVNYIGRRFDDIARVTAAKALIEKTCANSLRVDFVDRVVEDARYIYIRRSGIDVVASAQIRWKAPVDIPYLYKKSRFVPLSDLPFYAWRYLGHQLHRLTSAERRLGAWGPQINGMSDLLARHSLLQVCAIQWQRCVDAADQAFEKMPTEKYLELSYEEFVRSPVDQLENVLQFLNIASDRQQLESATKNINAESVGKGSAQLGSATVEDLLPFLGAPLDRYGYGINNNQ